MAGPAPFTKRLNMGSSTQAPVDGSFTVADPMAFIWAASYSLNPGARMGNHSITFRALREDQVIAETQIERTGLSADHIHESIASPDLVADFIAEPIDEPQPAMLVLGGSEGGLPSGSITGMLAMHGYPTLAVAYFGTTGLPHALEEIPLEYFANAITWLKRRPEVDPERIGVIGYSRGAELALLLGAHYPELGAVISVNGSGLVNSGIDWSDLNREPFPAWTWQGEPIPYYDASTNFGDAESIARITIPIEQTNGPVMLIAGEADELWPSTLLSGLAWDHLQQARREWPDELLTYPEAGHLIMPPYFNGNLLTSFRGMSFGGSQSGNVRAGADSWSPILNMLAWRFRTNL